MRRVVLAVLVASASLLTATATATAAATAAADEVVVVPGTAFPTGEAYLSWFGCADIFAGASAAPRATIGLEDAAPLGVRATRLALPGPGSASGPVSRVDAIGSAPWSFAVRPLAGGEGVAHVWYVSAELDPGEVWAGRADLSSTPGQWQQVQPASATYTWTRHVAATGEVVARAGEATIGGFTRAHGDGPGYLMACFGCDGGEFAVDAITAGTTTYDLEGLSVATTILTSQAQVTAGGEVEVIGTTLGPGQRPTGALLVLEARPEGADDFAPVAEPVTSHPDGTVSVTVTPEETTDYRWYQPGTGYADEGWSLVTTVAVAG